MLTILDVNTTFFTVLGYPMSYIEFFGTILNVWSVWLTARNKVLSWPVGIVAVILFFFLFFEIRLYSDMVEQVWYVVTGFWGWWVWTHPKRPEEADANKELKISYATFRENAWSVVIIAAGTLALGAFMARINLILPALFPQPADYPYLDAFTTVMSFVATVLMIRKRMESWYLWILVDVIGIWLYYVKDVHVVALEYVIFLTLAVAGLVKWLALHKAQSVVPAALVTAEAEA
jgi:nicotinamide mononucleotide transporter